MDEGEREPYEYEAAVVAMLTLRINTPGAEWLSDHDHEVFGTYQKEAVEADEEEWASEYMLLTMMNTAWLALVYLAGLTGESESMAPADRDGPSRSASARRRGGTRMHEGDERESQLLDSRACGLSTLVRRPRTNENR